MNIFRRNRGWQIMAYCLLPLAAFSQADLPKLTLPSAEAYEMTKFGDTPINEHTGMATASIPIHEYKVGSLSLPISLNYVGAGVTVNQACTWTGINWTLNAGGVISRTVEDNPDELSDTRLTGEDVDNMTLTYQSADTGTLYYAFDFDNLQYDTKPDTFSFSFGNYSGSFFLDADFVPHITKLDSNLRIEIVGAGTDPKTALASGRTFKITTPDGVMYYFGGANASEESFMTYTGHENITFNATTAYYLYRVEHPLYGAIFLEYDNISVPFLHKLNEDQSFMKKIWESFTIDILNDSQYCDGDELTTPLAPPKAVFNRIANGKFLRRIFSPYSDWSVEFVALDGSAPHYRKVLSEIQIKKDAVVRHNVELSYIFPFTRTNSSRFFLEKVSFDEGYELPASGKQHREFRMEYNDPTGLPPRFSFSQDHMGFYNGKSNSNLISKTDQPEFYAQNPYFSDRNPDFEYSAKGSLNKIIYPTGGYTQFEYEAPKARKFTVATPHLFIWRNSPLQPGDPQRVPITQTTQSMNIAQILLPGETGNSGAYQDQEIHVDWSITADHQTGHTDITYFKVIDTSTNPDPDQIFQLNMPDGNAQIGNPLFPYSGSLTFTVHKYHRYTVTFTNTYNSTISMEASATFSFVSGEEVTDDLGVRVKRVTDYDKPDQAASTRRFYYCRATDIGDASLLPFVQTPKYITPLTITKCCLLQEGSATLIRFCVLKMNSSPVGTFFRQHQQRYGAVTISHGGDNFENGGFEKTFYYEPNNFNLMIKPLDPPVLGCFEPDVYFADERLQYPGNANDMLNGTLAKEIEIQKVGATLYKKSEQTFNYSAVELAATSGITGGKSYIYQCPDATAFWPQSLIISKYGIFSKKIQLITAIKREYIDLMPITTPELYANSFRTFTNSTSYSYGQLIGLPTVIATTKPGYDTETHNVYAPDAATLSGLTTDQVEACNILTLINNVTSPIQTQTFGEGMLLFTKRTLFKKWTASAASVFPEKIQTAKGNQPLQDEVAFLNYDGHGNLSTFSRFGGAKTRLLYNTHDMLVQRIENFPGTLASYPVDNLPLPSAGSCLWQTTYPSAFVTTYHYNADTDLLERVVDQNCQSTFYEYDAFDRLLRTRDEDGNVIKQFQYNFRD